MAAVAAAVPSIDLSWRVRRRRCVRCRSSALGSKGTELLLSLKTKEKKKGSKFRDVAGINKSLLAAQVLLCCFAVCFLKACALFQIQLRKM
jgi:hypothetical protein